MQLRSFLAGAGAALALALAAPPAPALASNLAARAEQKYDAGDIAGARKDLEQAVKSAPDDGDAWSLLARVRFGWGRQRQRSGPRRPGQRVGAGGRAWRRSSHCFGRRSRPTFRFTNFSV